MSDGEKHSWVDDIDFNRAALLFVWIVSIALTIISGILDHQSFMWVWLPTAGAWWEIRNLCRR